jgi:hypothetical protein
LLILAYQWLYKWLFRFILPLNNKVGWLKFSFSSNLLNFF